MNQKTNSLIKSILAIFAISIIVACSSDDDNDPCANSTLAVSATVEEFTIKATATGGVEPYEYSIDGATFQSSDTFNDVESGNYTLTVRDANNCTSTTSVSEAHLNSLLDERDGQRYKIVRIGNQTWLAENFNYNTNTATETTSWCYDDVTTNCDTYGRLYTWEAASQELPEGWRLPTQGDWYTLINYFEGISIAYTELVNGDFNSLNAGARYPQGEYISIEEMAYYWTDTSSPDDNYYYFKVWEEGLIQSEAYGGSGLSVRLIKIQNN